MITLALAKEIILGSKKECKYGVYPVSTFQGNFTASFMGSHKGCRHMDSEGKKVCFYHCMSRWLKRNDPKLSGDLLALGTEPTKLSVLTYYC